MLFLCGSMFKALSMIVDGQLMTPLKCSIPLSKVSILSVRRLLPSTLSSGMAQEPFGP